MTASQGVPTSLLQDGGIPQGNGEIIVDGGIVDGGVIEDGMVDGGMIVDGGDVLYEGGAGCTSCGNAGCSSCGIPQNSFGIDICNPTGIGGRQLCICLPAHGWVSVDYLGWYQSGMSMPAMVSTSPTGTAQSAAGVLPSASVLFGGDDSVLSDTMNGTRVRVGVWSATRPNAGAEGEYFGFSQQSETFDQSSTGNPILARPFYNNVTGVQDAQLVAFPSLLSGRVAVEATSQLNAAAVRFRHLLCCSNACGYSVLACAPVQAQSRFDATLGWRYMQLREGLMIQENLTSLDTSNPGSFLIEDDFSVFNQFNGVELGVEWLGRRGFWTLEALMRVNFGNTRQSLTIDGSTRSPANGPVAAGGMLAQPGRNIGTYTRDEFAMVPEIGLTLGYQLTQRLKMNFGYSFLYWTNVVRPGDQIDTTVNPNLFPPAQATNTFLGPDFAIRDTDYWVQGLSVGGEYRW